MHSEPLEEILNRENLMFVPYGVRGFESISKDSGWQIKKFADKLKDIVCMLIGCTRAQLEDRGFKETPLGEEWDELYYPIDQWGVPIKDKAIRKMTPRLLLQLLGTECGRKIIHPNIWCNALFSNYIGDIEEWKNIQGYEGKYQVSSFGNVRSLDRIIEYGDISKGQYHSRKGQLLTPTNSNGYLTVGLSGKTFTVHSLVANAFLNKSANNLIINHIDCNKSNNFYKNLEWITQKENIQNSIKTTNGNVGSNQKDAKLNEELVIEIKELLNSKKMSQAKIATLYGVSTTTISEIKTGKKWKHVGETTPLKDPTPILPISPPNWIITDVRFPNEAEAIKSKGGIVIRVNRPCKECHGIGYHKMDCNIGRYEHESERALDKYGHFDHIIENDGTIEDLLQKVKNII